MKVLITGVSGFIAPHLAEIALEEGWEVVGVDKRACTDQDGVFSFLENPKFTFLHKDARDLTYSDLDGVDYIFHFGFVTNIPFSTNSPIATTEENLGMMTRILSLASEANIKKVLYPSTASLYGYNKTPWREDMPADPIEPYSFQKVACEQMLRMWHNMRGLKTATLRLYQVFGENQRPDTALAAFFRSRVTGKPITLTRTTAQSSFDSAQRDFIYNKDVARAFIAAALSDKVGAGEIINIASGNVYTVREVAEKIGGQITFIERRGYEVERHEADLTRTRELIPDWKPQVDILDWIPEQVARLESKAKAKA